MLAAYILCSVWFALLILYKKNEKLLKAACGAFYVLQGAFAVWMLCGNVDTVQLEYFRLDRTGVMFFVLLSLISPIAFRYSLWYLDREEYRERSIYHALMILLCMSASCVYFSDNVAVTWIFLEATTICTAGLVYHRRNPMSLEATWKYVFVCSVGISMAYLGVLLLGGMTSNSDLSYTGLALALSDANVLYLKVASLFILAGYSCKLEIFPLYPIGVDANLAAPTPASALISTGLVNAGFVAIFRIYKVMEPTPIFDWFRSVFVIAGVVSVIVGAFFMRRTRHYKRFLSYSTVENMGLVAIGLGIGGWGVYAALFHVAGHSLLKSAMFLQMAQAGKIYGNYKVNQMADYINVNCRGAVLLLLTTIMMLGFPPSPLFISELMLFKQMIAAGQYWLLAITVLGICVVIYNIGRNIIKLCYAPSVRKVAPYDNISWSLVVPVIVLLVLSTVFGMWQPEWLIEWFEMIIN